MKIQILLLSTFILFAAVGTAQVAERQVIAAGGASFAGNFYADWTMGEIAVQSAIVNGTQIQQGYQQPVPASGSGVLRFSDAGVRMYPNPCSGTCYLEWEGMSQAITVELFNMLGEQIQRRCWETAVPCVLELSSLPPGSYLIQLTGAHTKLHATLIRI